MVVDDPRRTNLQIFETDWFRTETFEVRIVGDKGRYFRGGRSLGRGGTRVSTGPCRRDLKTSPTDRPCDREIEVGVGVKPVKDL